MTDHAREREKWGQLARQWTEIPDYEEELAEHITCLLKSLDPPVHRLLEAGCGSALTSIGLANRGFKVDLLDFSEEAISGAKKVWASHVRNSSYSSLFHCVDLVDATPESLGVAPYDCVYNAGVLEHYEDGEIVDLLQAMARLSRYYVIALVPNSRCAVYRWWRWHHEHVGTWPYGKEVPRTTLTDLMKEAGLEPLLEVPMGHTWTFEFARALGEQARELQEWFADDDLPDDIACYLICSVARTASPKGRRPLERRPEEILLSFQRRWLDQLRAEQRRMRLILQNENRLRTASEKAKDEQLGKVHLEIQALESRLELREERMGMLEKERDEAEAAAKVKDEQLEEVYLEAQALQSWLDLQDQQFGVLEKERDEADAAARAKDRQLDEADAAARTKDRQLEEMRVRTQTLENQMRLRDKRLRALEKEVEQHQDFRGALAEARAGAVGVVGTLEGLRITTSYRIARWLTLVRNAVFRGPLLGRLKFIGRSVMKLLGSRQPLSPINPLNVPMNEAHRVISAVDRVLGGRTGLPVVPAPASQPAGTGAPERDLLRLGTPLAAPIASWAADPSVVNIVTILFMDMDGRELLCGGAERYLLELCGIIRELGYHPIVHQAANGSWERTYRGVRVVGIDVGGDIQYLNDRFHRVVGPGALTIYSSFCTAGPLSHPNSLGISHGIFWDQKGFQTPGAASDHWMGIIGTAIRNCSRLVSVDTNTINWVRSTMVEQAGKFTYIPNFVDTEEFRPREGGPSKDGKIVILYPRRLYPPRGFWLVEKLVPYILKKYPQVEFRFVGKADDEEAKAARKMEARHGPRVQWRHLEPDEMSRVYREADITLCPTVASEGTSLSCLEAMASGNAVIATNVGGLPELIVDGYSGLLVAPVLEELREAIERLLNDEELRVRLQRNARQVSLSYRKGIWQERWRGVLRSVLPPPPGGWDSVRDGYRFVHLDAGGVVWDRMKQRPHHLFRAVAEAGHKAYFVNDASRSDTPDPILGLKVLGREDLLPLDRPILYIYFSYNYLKIRNFRNPVVIYDILDDPKIHEEADSGKPPDANYLYYHEKLLSESQIVMTSSRLLYERYRPKRPDILLVPNAVWPEDFRVEERRRPDDLPPDGRVLVGYYGAVAEWFDLELLGFASEACPDYEFVLIGLTNREADLDEFTVRHPNVHYLGEKRYEQLPQYLAHFDVAILPFLVNEVTNAVCPVKLFEYAAGGKPVVSTAFREVQEYEAVLVAQDKEDFVRKLKEALKMGDDPAYREQLSRLAEENTWRERVGTILAELDRRLGDSGAGSHENR